MTRPAVLSRRIGSLQIHAIQAGVQRLDGGAMFGIVPKPLWEKRIPSDERNRIKLGMRCLVLEHPAGLVLIDSGVGNKENDKFRNIYGIENEGADSRTWLEDGLREIGATATDVALVINTHLHFDHAGGDTFIGNDGVIRPTFPAARHVVQEGDYEFATHTNERTAGSYLLHNFEPVVKAGLFDFVRGEQRILDGITVLPTPGHVPGHQSVLIESSGESALFLGDLVPTSAHLPLPWIMGYDVEPLVSLESRRRILASAVERHWLLVFEHDFAVPWGYARADGGSYRLE
jgi:glyoxylase-like metal-dependent hydrolase (beta-lactamase superfamily II)